MVNFLSSWAFTPVAFLEVIVNWLPFLMGQNPLSLCARAKLCPMAAGHGEVWILKPNSASAANKNRDVRGSCGLAGVQS